MTDLEKELARAVGVLKAKGYALPQILAALDKYSREGFPPPRSDAGTPLTPQVRRLKS